MSTSCEDLISDASMTEAAEGSKSSILPAFSAPRHLSQLIMMKSKGDIGDSRSG